MCQAYLAILILHHKRTVALQGVYIHDNVFILVFNIM